MTATADPLPGRGSGTDQQRRRLPADGAAAPSESPYQQAVAFTHVRPSFASPDEYHRFRDAGDPHQSQTASPASAPDEEVLVSKFSVRTNATLMQAATIPAAPALLLPLCKWSIQAACFLPCCVPIKMPLNSWQDMSRWSDLNGARPPEGAHHNAMVTSGCYKPG